MDIKSSNSKIARNTLILYGRMFVSIIVNLYTVRLLWNVLGIEDYGIFNVVGGVVFLFAFLNNAMVASSQRFISYELGKGNKENLARTFSTSVSIHFVLAFIILLLAESIGLWFLNNKMNIPQESIGPANWVYQCSIFTFLLTVISVPYNASIVAHEHINIFGYFGILDIFLKLGIVFLVSILPYNRLKAYSICLLILSIIMRMIYGIYCSLHFEECRWKGHKDHLLLKQMFGFAGWNFLGNMGIAVRDQGSNIILNLFFDVAVNAAKGISNQVTGVINGFTSNFTMAINPQITKRYAAGEINSMLSLVFNGCKYSLMLMGLIVIPSIIAAPMLLKLWLGEVAPYTIGFLKLMLVIALIECIANPIVTSIHATGEIKKFQIWISMIFLSSLPFSWILLKFCGSPYTVILVNLSTSIIALLTRIKILHELIPFSYTLFFKRIYSRTLPTIIIVGVISYYCYSFISDNFLGLICFSIISTITYCLFSYIFILSQSEKEKLKKIILQRLTRFISSK